ncbi:hypothetical protein SDC9_124491 [bioreactor metagenome]|uniref:Uncharacterized protein n=1 Tax=bioreactor metagenome TaxID=1076179 RepID=A0A645CKQ6_9ZZZZ
MVVYQNLHGVGIKYMLLYLVYSFEMVEIYTANKSRSVNKFQCFSFGFIKHNNIAAIIQEREVIGVLVR